MSYENVKDHFFPLPNDIFTLGLTAGEVAVYSYLSYCEDRSTYKCHPSYKTIGKALHMSKNTVSKYVRMLEDKRLIKTEPTQLYRKGMLQNANLKYTILPVKEAVKLYYDRQYEKSENDMRARIVKEKYEKWEKNHPRPILKQDKAAARAATDHTVRQCRSGY